MKRLTVVLLAFLLTAAAWGGPNPARATAERLTSDAEELAARGRWQDVMHVLDQALEADPTYSHAWRMKGLTLGVLKQYKEALVCANKVIGLEPTRADGWMLRGQLLLDKGEVGDALSAYNRAIELEPKEGRAFLGRGNVHMRSTQWGKASEDFATATRLLPGYDFAWYNRGLAHLKQKDYNKALNALEEATFLNSRFAPAFAAKGEVLYAMKRKPAATASFKRALALDPKVRKEIPKAILKELKL